MEKERVMKKFGEEFCETPEEHFDDPVDYHESKGDHIRANAIKRKRGRILFGEDVCPHTYSTSINEDGISGVFCEECGEKLDDDC
jgi:dihydroorotase